MNLINKLSDIENKIKSICIFREVSNVDEFSYEEITVLYQLLNEKLETQKALFKEQGGDLSNVFFIASYRK